MCASTGTDSACGFHGRVPSSQSDPWHSLAALVLAVMAVCASPVVAAEPPASPQGPTMARFYVVDDSGQSVADPELPTRKVERKERAVTARAHRPKTRRGQPAGRQGEMTRAERANEIYRVREAAWRCERHGFFYTSDGRCILPVIQRPQHLPPATERPPIRRQPRMR